MNKHVPVLKNECIESLNIKSNGIYVDCTAGRGGHVEAILEANPDVQIIAIDKDPVNSQFLSERFKNKKVIVVTSDYKNIDDIISFNNIKKIDGMLFDLGFSSIHVDDAQRGFSFSKDGPLDMRYNREQSLTAEIVVNEYEELELKKVIRDYGEEPFYNRVVHAIVNARVQKRIQTTSELKRIINSAIPVKNWSPKKIDTATKTFQALRIEVNAELESLSIALDKATDLLNVGGRLCVITFHSLGDRIVKTKFNNEAKTCTCPRGLVQCVCDTKPRLKVITKRVTSPSEDELRSNPRARSAKLRVAEKLDVR